jgi:hypothetical protein
MARRPISTRDLPLGAELAPTIDRLKAIAAEAADSLFLSDGPSNPDRALLDTCAHALALLRRAESNRATLWTSPSEPQDPRATVVLVRNVCALERRALQLMRAAAKLPAKSPPGIYAKALLVRSAARGTGAGVLGASLASDLIACTALRLIIWPAAGPEALP